MIEFILENKVKTFILVVLAFTLVRGVVSGILGSIEDSRRIELKKSSLEGDAEAQFKLARSYATSENATWSPTDAFRYFLKAAKAGHTEAQFEVGQAYELGRGVDSNWTEALEWYSRAKDNGHPKAEELLRK